MMKKIYFAVLTVVVLMFSGCAEMPIQNPALTMHNAAKAGNIAVVDSLLKQGHNVDELYFGTSLVWAAEAGQIEMVKFLLQNGANIDARAQQGWTPLGNALFMNQTATSNYLIEKGVNIDNTLVGFNDWKTYCRQNNIIDSNCVNKILPLENYLNDLKLKKQAETDALKQQQVQSKMQEEVDKFIADKNLNGLKEYADQNPNAVYYIKDEVIRLALMGPKGLKIGDIREYLQSGKSELILLSMIKQQEVPYKKFSLQEIDMLLTMGLSEKVIAALIDETTELLRNEKLRQQQEFYMAEQKKVAALPQTIIYQNNQNQQPQQNQVMDKVENEVIKQGVGLLLDQLFR
jgi:hypothetical protein